MITASLSSLAGAQDNTYTYPSNATLDDVAACIQAVPAAHPRLMAAPGELAALRGCAEGDGLKAAVAKAVLREADGLLEVAPVTRKKTGRRLLGVSRTCLKRTLLLATAYHLTGNDAYAERCRGEMLAAAGFSDWNPSHYLDVGEMCLALAVGYDWLYSTIPEAERQLIRTAILERALRVPETTRHKGWIRAGNNWGQVCHGGMVAGALAVAEHDSGLAARTVHRAVTNVHRAMNAYAPNGSYPEGPGYWSYGTTYNVILLSLLRQALGTEFGLEKAPGFSKTAAYVEIATGPSGQTFNYADGGSGRSSQPALYWFAKRFGRPDWTRHDRTLLAALARKLTAKSAGGSGHRFFPLALLWMGQAPADDDIRMPLQWEGKGKVPVTVHRSSWTDPDATFVGVKAGSPSGPHGQMDSGSFVLDACGVRWALDLGAEGYHGIESRGMNLWSSKQDSDRWTIHRQQNHGHNTLVIDDRLQVAKGNATVKQFHDGGDSGFTVVDLSPVYAGQAASVHRGIRLFSGGQVLIRDELTGLKPGARVRWGMITRAETAVRDDRAYLERDGERLVMALLRPWEGPGWQTYDSATPKNEWDSPNRGTTMVGFEAVAGDDGVLALAVMVTPGCCTDPVQRLNLTPPQDWTVE